jgi:hypothetical protein
MSNEKTGSAASASRALELGAGWDACIASLGRPAAQSGIKALMALGFHKPGDVENRLGYYLTQYRARPALHAILNSRTLRLGGVEENLGGHVSKNLW